MSSEDPASRRKPIPQHLTNGTSNAQASISSQEREKLVASIRSSSNGRQSVDLEDTQQQFPRTDGDSILNKLTIPTPAVRPNISSRLSLSERPRDPRDEKERPQNGFAPPSANSRPESPYTRNPPIDFDGLSWPSKHKEKKTPGLCSVNKCVIY